MSEAQTFCNKLGTSVYCDGYDGNQTTITPLGRTGGVITQDDYRGHSSMTPYNVMPVPHGLAAGSNRCVNRPASPYDETQSLRGRVALAV
jgi:hypothetical protein